MSVLEEETMVKVFRQCYALISSAKRGSFVLWFCNFSSRLKGPMKDTFKRKLYWSKKWRGKWVIVKYGGITRP